jgi:hypothetical protein
LPAEIAARRQTAAPAPQQAVAAAAPEQDRDAARRRVAGGGLFRDELTFSIRYRPVGHADPFVTAWIDLLAEATGGPYATLAEALMTEQLAPTAPGLCGSCHSVERGADGRLTVNWFAKQPTDAGNGFTVFSHGPHLTQAQLAECKTCHAINPAANVSATYTGHSPDVFIDGFEPLTRESCAKCHTSRAAGDRCTQCHRYHAGERPTASRVVLDQQ